MSPERLSSFRRLPQFTVAFPYTNTCAAILVMEDGQG